MRFILLFITLATVLLSSSTALIQPAMANTDNQCYSPANAGTVGQSGWTGCEGMYIVADLTALISMRDNNYQITSGGVSYTFADSTHNIFTGQVKDMSGLFYQKPHLTKILVTGTHHM